MILTEINGSRDRLAEPVILTEINGSRDRLVEPRDTYRDKWFS